jgi:competence protein ComEC
MNTHTKTIIFVVGVLLGIVCGESSRFASEIAIVGLMLASVQMLLYILERKRKQRSTAYSYTSLFSFSLLTSLLFFGLSIGIIRVQLVSEKTLFICDTVCSYDARIISSPEIKNEYQIFDVQPFSKNADVYDIKIKTPLYPKYHLGEIVTLVGKVTIPSVIFPHSTTKNIINGFDYTSYLHVKNIGSEMFYPQVKVIDTDTHHVKDILGRWKENLVARLDDYVSSPASSLASGMLFGATSMSTELLQTFRIAGLSHIVVLSGFNIVVVITSILFVLAFLPLVFRVVLASLSVIIFVTMVGASPSVIRATLMAFIALLATLLGRVYVAKQALILSLLAIVMYEPDDMIYDVSLHLSFLATMGLVYMSEALELFVKKYFSYFTSSSLRELLITTLSAYFATLPYVMYTFGTVSVYALIANIFVVPLVPFAMLISFFVVMSSYLSNTLSLVFGFVDTLIINVMIWFAHVVEKLPFSTVTLTVSLSTMSLMYLFIFIVVNYISVSCKDETQDTKRNENLTDIISY